MLFDIKDVTYRFLFKPSISSLMKGMKFIEEGKRWLFFTKFMDFLCQEVFDKKSVEFKKHMFHEFKKKSRFHKNSSIFLIR